jgi:hypothetical protein
MTFETITDVRMGEELCEALAKLAKSAKERGR